MGDFNFKVDREKEEVVSLLSQHKEKAYKILEKSDEFYTIKAKHQTISVFREATINFLPSYKYNKDTKSIDTGFKTPSWTDRILYQQVNSQIVAIEYGTIPVFLSDHLPVYLLCKIN